MCVCVVGIKDQCHNRNVDRHRGLPSDQVCKGFVLISPMPRACSLSLMMEGGVCAVSCVCVGWRLTM